MADKNSFVEKVDDFFKAVEYGQCYTYYLERVIHEERSAHTDVTYLHIPFKSRLEIGWQATHDLRLLETQLIKIRVISLYQTLMR